MPLLCPVKVAIGDRSEDRHRRIDLSWDPVRLGIIVVGEGKFVRVTLVISVVWMCSVQV